MSFFKQVLATIVGLTIFQIIAFCLAIIFFIAIASTAVGGGSGDNMSAVQIENNSIITIDLSSGLSEKDGFTAFTITDIESLPAEQAGLQSVLKAIEFAKTDDRIEGMVIKMTVLPEGYATIDALRRQLLDFKESGKFIMAYGEMLDQKSYYLATVADEIYINPEGYMDFRGIGSRLTFFKKMLEEKLRAEVQVFKVGDFKSAVEPFIMEEMSAENRKQLEYILGGIKEDFVSNIASQRNLTEAEIDDILNNLRGIDPDSSTYYGLIDGTKYYDEIIAMLKDKTSTDTADDLSTISLNAYATATASKEKSANQIAVVYAEGDIVDGMGDELSIGGEKFAKIIRDLRRDEDIDAIVLRVNSPGGSALASEVMWRELALAKELKPVVVSMGDLAASGGYYIACNADKIYAEENTITGSIGVFGLVPNMSEFLNDKIGVTFDDVLIHEHAVSNGITKAFTPFEAKVMQNNVNKVYETFTTRVAEGRNLPIENVLTVASGRVWTGEQALERGLVDELGDLNAAIAHAAELAELDNFRMKEYPLKKSPFESILADLGFEASEAKLKNTLGTFYPHYEQLKYLEKTQGKVQAKLPFVLEIN